VDFPKGRISLFLTEIGEPSNNDLRLVVAEGIAGPLENTQFGEARRIAPDETSRVFELIWCRYVAYSVRNESFTSLKEGEEPPEDMLTTRTNSAYLDYVKAATFASDDYPGPLTHWSLYTEWHCIDVVSDKPPEIRQIGPLSDGQVGSSQP
jgi:hypothetical protein